jgi:16S rRNA C967 or C1407 C5-methylase (RsmB/RsmF family)
MSTSKTSAKSSKSNKTIKGADAFEQHFSARFGERWPGLKAALTQEGQHTSLQGLIQDYWLDPASVLAAQALDVQPGHQVLDMCAAPGGKSLVLALALKGEGKLISNEFSSARRARLWRVLDEHLPPALRPSVDVLGRDGGTFGRSHPEMFDRILVDAPCGSESHVLQSPEHLSTWGPKRPKQMAERQFALLCSAFDALKPGGILVYSTCSISAEENDGVCAKLLKKRQGVCWLPPQNTYEPTELGNWILPDQSPGQGPLFWARLQKLSESDS